MVSGKDESEHITTQNLWDTAKAVLRGKFTVIQAYLKKDRNISNKQPNPTSTRTGGKTTKLRASRKKEIIKIRAELNDIGTKTTIQRINTSRSSFFKKINKIYKPLSRLIKKKRERTQVKSEIRVERFQLIPQKYKEL